MDLKILKTDPKRNGQYYGPPPTKVRPIPQSPLLEKKKQELKMQRQRLEDALKIDNKVEQQRQGLERIFNKVDNPNDNVADVNKSQKTIHQEVITSTKVDNSQSTKSQEKRKYELPEQKAQENTIESVKSQDAPEQKRKYELPKRKTKEDSVESVKKQDAPEEERKYELPDQKAKENTIESVKSQDAPEQKAKEDSVESVKKQDAPEEQKAQAQETVIGNEIPIVEKKETYQSEDNKSKMGGKMQGLEQEIPENSKVKSSKLPNNFIKPNKVATDSQAGRKEESNRTTTTTTTTTTTSQNSPNVEGSKKYQLPQKPTDNSNQDPLALGVIAGAGSIPDNQLGNTDDNRINENDFENGNGQRMNASELTNNSSNQDSAKPSKQKEKPGYQEDQDEEDTYKRLDDYDNNREGGNFGIPTGTYIDGKFVGGGINQPNQNNKPSDYPTPYGNGNGNGNPNYSPNSGTRLNTYKPTSSGIKPQPFSNSLAANPQTPRYAQTLQGSPTTPSNYSPYTNQGYVAPAIPKGKKRTKKGNYLAEMIGKIIMFFVIASSLILLLISGTVVGVIGYAVHSTLAPICSNGFILNAAKLAALTGNPPAIILVQSCRVFSQITGIGCEPGTGPVTGNVGGGGRPGGTGNSASCIAAELKSNASTVNMGYIRDSTIQSKKQTILEIMKYGREVNADEFTIRFAIALHPMESNLDGWSSINQFGCVGLLQFCPGSYEEAINYDGTSTASFRADPKKQMRTIENFIRIKRGQVANARQCVRDFFVGKSEIFKISYAWFTGAGTCPGGVDGNNLSNLLYSPVADTNYNKTDCNEWRELLQTFPVISPNAGQTAYLQNSEGIQSFINSITYLNPFMVTAHAQSNILDLKVDPVQAPITSEEAAFLDVVAVKESGKYANRGSGDNRNMGKYQIMTSDIPDAQKALDKAGYTHKINSDFNPISQDYLAIGRILRNAQLMGDNKKLSEILAGPDGFMRALGYASREFQALPAVPGYPHAGAVVNNGLTIEVARQYFEQQLKIYREKGVGGNAPGTGGAPVAPGQPVPLPSGVDTDNIGAGTGNYCVGVGSGAGGSGGSGGSGIPGGNFDGSNASSDLSEFDKWYKEKKVIVPNSEGNRKAIFDDVYAGNVSPAVIKVMVALASSGKFTRIGVWSLYRPPGDPCSSGRRHPCGKAIDIEWLEVGGKKLKHLEGFNGNREAQAAFLEAAKIIRSTKVVDQIISCGPMATTLTDTEGFKGRGNGSVDNISVVNCTGGNNVTETHQDHHHISTLMEINFTPKGR